MPAITVLSTAHIHTKSFLENLQKGADGRRIHAIWDDVADRGRRYAEQFQARFEPDLGKALADPAVQGFCICAENTRHLPLLEKAIPTGKPVFCEKPLVTTAADAARVAALARKHAATVVCGYFQPFFAPNRAVKKLLAEGGLGTVTRARFRNAHHAAYGRWFDNPDLAWFHNPELAGGGAFMDMGTHAVHLLRHLLGPVTACWAVIDNHSRQYPSCDDYGLAQLRFASGVLGTVEAAWTQTGGIGGLEVTGSTGCVWSDGARLVHGVPGKPAAPLADADARPDRMDRLVAAALGRIDKAELAEDLACCLDAAAIMAACYASARSGRWEDVAKVA